jgi:hypothetical protein
VLRSRLKQKYKGQTSSKQANESISRNVTHDESEFLYDVLKILQRRGHPRTEEMIWYFSSEVTHKELSFPLYPMP